MAVLSHYNIRRVVDIYGAVQDRDLGAVGRDIGADRRREPNAPAARFSFVTVRGQIETMRTSYIGLADRARPSPSSSSTCSSW